MKRRIALLLATALCAVSFAACTGGGTTDPGTSTTTQQTQAPASTAPADNTTPASTEPAAAAETPIVPGLTGVKFDTTRNITVEIYDRNNDGGTSPIDNFYTNWIKAQMLEKHNVAVTYQSVGRWTEGQDLNNLLAAGSAPDVCVTYDGATIQLYADMGGVVELTPYLEQMESILPNLWERIGDRGVYWDKNPDTGLLYSLEGKRANVAKNTTFVRTDWLKKLNLQAPKNVTEFHDMLVAFRDNAELLLGADAKSMIPLYLTYDAGWTGMPLILSYIPGNLTDKEFYVNGFDSRYITMPNVKEAVRVLNQWYNEGLIWKDFALYGAGDNTGSNLAKAGYTGAQLQNWDQLFRDGDDSVVANIRRVTGDDTAGFEAIECFPNDTGKVITWPYNPIGSDRKVFLPGSNKEIEASLLYIDFISSQEALKFLQMGEEGVTHEVDPTGGYRTIAVTGEKIMNSLNNIDYTITCNGLDFGDFDTMAKSFALNYSGVEPEIVAKAFELSQLNPRFNEAGNLGTVTSEAGVGTTLDEKRDKVYDQAIVAPVAQFDAVWDAGVKDWLQSGGQAILDERAAIWESRMGSSTSLIKD